MPPRSHYVDVMQLFLGDAAARAAQPYGSEQIPPPNDVWIRNTSRSMRGERFPLAFHVVI